MKLESKYFDSIRVKPDKNRLSRDRHPECQWRGCSEPGQHKAPMGRGREGQYFQFCLTHVRAYNKAYNYFDGMSDDEVVDYQKSALTGHRPTWSMGSKPGAEDEGKGAGGATPGGFSPGFGSVDPHEIFGRAGGEDQSGPVTRRPLGNMERKCLTELNLDEYATASTIKARFKQLVKRHHPDLNGRDKGSEDKLRDVIQAYNYLKQAGLC